MLRRITVYGVPVDVEFTSSRGYAATEWEPACDDEICIDAVFVDEIDILHLMGEKALEEVAKELWKLFDNRDKEDFE